MLYTNLNTNFEVIKNGRSGRTATMMDASPDFIEVYFFHTLALYLVTRHGWPHWINGVMLKDYLTRKEMMSVHTSEMPGGLDVSITLIQPAHEASGIRFQFSKLLTKQQWNLNEEVVIHRMENLCSHYQNELRRAAFALSTLASI